MENRQYYVNLLIETKMYLEENYELMTGAEIAMYIKNITELEMEVNKIEQRDANN